MTGGTISAEGYASALCYCGGSLNITGGELYYGEGGSGCALYIEYAGEIMFPENTKAKLKSDDLYGLMGGNRYSSDWGVWYSDYNSYYDYTYSPCHTCKHPVISIGYSGQPNWCYPYYSSDSYFYVDLSAGRYHTYA